MNSRFADAAAAIGDPSVNMRDLAKPLMWLFHVDGARSRRSAPCCLRKRCPPRTLLLSESTNCNSIWARGLPGTLSKVSRLSLPAI